MCEEKSVIISEMSDSEFLVQFENQTLPPEMFNHIAHIRLAWLYVRVLDVDTATEKTCAGLKAYAESLGAKDKFHLTISHALVRIIALRMNESHASDWPEFIAQNRDLVEDAIGVLCRYFSYDRLMSDKARVELVLPDIQALA